MTEITSFDSKVVAFMAKCHNLCGYVAFEVNDNVREAAPEYFSPDEDDESWESEFCLSGRLSVINEITYCHRASEFDDLENRAIPIVGDTADIGDDWLIVGFDNDHTWTLTNRQMVDDVRQMYNAVVAVRAGE